MPDHEIALLRPARPGDGQALFEVTRASIAGLAASHYSPQHLANWMGERTPAFYEAAIAQGRMIVAEQAGRIVGFVDAEPGEVTRLFVLPETSGLGLGQRLLAFGIAEARGGHTGPIIVESTLNAEGFYRRHGFRRIKPGHFSHGLDEATIEIVLMELRGDAANFGAERQPS